MKTTEQVIKMIEEKKAEHVAIAKQIATDVEVLRAKLAEMIQNKAAKGALVTQTQAMMVIKDQMMFHKAAILVYDELLKELGT